jgi:hypothetical protein
MISVALLKLALKFCFARVGCCHQELMNVDNELWAAEIEREWIESDTPADILRHLGPAERFSEMPPESNSSGR